MGDAEPFVFDGTARSNINSAWGALAVEVLARLGLEYFVISPGSRSTPLTFAAARNPKIEAIPLIDERSAAFFALGLAKRTRRPVALICTSGSALANYFPAVVEASMSKVPLLLLTTDRPPELQDCWAGQTIDQLKIFGDYVSTFHQMALPAREQFAYLRQTLVHSAARLGCGSCGPIHLNFPFQDPLPPTPARGGICTAEDLEEAATILSRVVESSHTVSNFDSVAVERLISHSKGIIVVGEGHLQLEDEAFADAIAVLSHKMGWPVICDILNPLRNHSRENGAIVASYDYFLRSKDCTERLTPTAVLQIGQLPTSKVLRAWLDEANTCSFLLSSTYENTDPLHRTATPLYGTVASLAEALPQQKADQTWLDAWLKVEDSASRQLESAMKCFDDLFEGKVSWLLSKHAPVGSALFLANSMSVRYAELFWSKGNRAIGTFCNRGANGIDGTLSTAMGVAHRGVTTFLLTGDLAFLHDSNGLLAAQDFSGSLTVIVVNNRGGGIFENLPISAQGGVFETYFATSHDVDLSSLSQAHHVSHTKISSWSELQELICGPAYRGVRILEIRTDRKADSSNLKELMGSFEFDG